MDNIKTFFKSVPQFFVILLASVLRLFTFGKASQEQATSDLESGLSVSTMAKADPGSDESAVTAHVDVDDTQLQAKEAVDIFTPIRPRRSSRGSNLPRRKSIYRKSPVIQKEADAIIPATTTPDLVASVPCTIQPLAVTITCTSSFMSTKAEQVARLPHSANIVRVNTIEMAQTIIGIESESTRDLLKLFNGPPRSAPSHMAEKSIDIESESTRDLRELFNGPPPRSAPSPPSSSGLPALPTANFARILVESCTVHASGAVHMRPAFILTKSNSESALTMQSPSVDMTEFSLDGNPKYLSPETAYDVDVSCSSKVDIAISQEDDVSNNLAACFSDEDEDNDTSEDEALRLAWKECTLSRQSVTITKPSSGNLFALTCTSSQDSQKNVTSQDNMTSQDNNSLFRDSEGHYDFLDLPYPQDSDDTLCPMNSKYTSDLDITANHASLSTPPVLLTHYHNVVDGFTQADRHKGDIVDENRWSKIGNTATLRYSDSVLRRLLRTSPTAEAVVDFIFAQLEQEQEQEQECRGDDAKCDESRQSLALITERVASSDEVKSPRMGKSKMLTAAVAKDTEIEQAARANWEASLESDLQALSKMQTEDKVFRGYSQNSMKNNSVDDKVVCNNKPKGEELLTLCEAPRDVAQVVDNSDELVTMSLVVKDVWQMMDAKLGETEVMSLNDSDNCRRERRLARFSWTSTESSTTTEDDDSGEVGNSSNSDQWSDLLELDEHIA